MIIKKYFTKMICKRDVIHINGGMLVKKLSDSLMFFYVSVLLLFELQILSVVGDELFNS